MHKSPKKVTRRKNFDMKAYLDRLLDESDDRANFPLVVRHNSCDRVTWPVYKLNEAAKKGDWEEVERIRSQLLAAVFELEGME